MSEVTIFLFNWNGKNLTQKCLQSITENTVYNPATIVVVDQGSTDGSVDMIRSEYPDVELIENDKNIGYSSAFNQVLDRYQSDYYIHLDNDTTVESEWLQPLVDLAEQAECGVIGPQIKFPDGRVHAGGEFGPFGGQRFVVKDEEQYSQVREVDWVGGAAFFLTDEVARENDGMDELFNPIYFEEVDFCYRARKNGFRVLYCPDSVVHHEAGASMEKDPQKLYLQKRNGTLFWVVNYPASWLVPRALYEAVQFGYAFVESDRKKRVSSYFQAYRDIVVDRREVIEKRNERKTS